MSRINLFARLSHPLFREVYDCLSAAHGAANLRVFAPVEESAEDRGAGVADGLLAEGAQIFFFKKVARVARALRRHPRTVVYLMADDPACVPIWTLAQEFPGVVLGASETYDKLFDDIAEEPVLGWRQLALGPGLVTIDLTSGEADLAAALSDLSEAGLRASRRDWCRRRVAERAGAAAGEVFSPEVAGGFFPEVVPRVGALIPRG